MNKKNLEAVGRLLEAVKSCFDEAETGVDAQQRTPAQTITPRLYRGLCRTVGADEKTSFLLASFAIALVAGMVQNPKDVASMCGGGGYFGGSIIVALEELKVKNKY